ncbi:MAG: hypothetical protein FWG44_07690 [Oscillospiraceae bacterium]|nr:hypothetical protein [Oscillospiraceae bacterium]
MATNNEQRAAQKEKLYDLLKLKRDNDNKGIKVEGLEELINRVKAPMEVEDVAYIEKLIAELE